MYQFRCYIARRHVFVISMMILFAIFFWYFDLQGGYYLSPSYPSPRAIWIYMPTIEGFIYALMVAWYDNSFKHAPGKFSFFIARIGTYSYSIYLWHFFIVFNLSTAIDIYIVDLSNIYIAMLFSSICFLLMVPIGFFSYKFIESPFLQSRTCYFSREVVIPSRSALARGDD